MQKIGVRRVGQLKVIALSLALSSPVQAMCLTPLNNGEAAYGGWQNSCDVGIGVL